MKPFYILGLPRSRTLWFSELFTFDDVECKHEHFSVHEKRELIPGIRGYSDTNPLVALDRDYGDSPVLLINRDINDVNESVYNAFDKPDGIECWKGSIFNCMKAYKEAFDSLAPADSMSVDFDSINHSLEEIWEFLLPDIPVDIERIEKYKNKIIKTSIKNIEGNLHNTFGSMESFSKQYDFLATYRITDYTISNYIIDGCWDEISEDNVESYTPDILTEYWIGLSDGDNTIGCYRFHQIYAATWEGHAFILPEYREEYAALSGRTIFNWILTETDFKKVVANVPKRFPNVMGFLENAGFKREGVNRQSYTKDGKLWDMIHYGLTRTEIEELI